MEDAAGLVSAGSPILLPELTMEMDRVLAPARARMPALNLARLRVARPENQRMYLLEPSYRQ